METKEGGTSKMGKTIGILIPEDCKQIYIFENKKDFNDQISTGRMKPLYGANASEKDFMNALVAYSPITNHK